MMMNYYGHGKLLLSGEYFVLDGARALAFPTRQGQRMEVSGLPGPDEIVWNAKDQKGDIWLAAKFSKSDLALLETTDQETAGKLAAIFQACRQLNPSFEKQTGLTRVNTCLEFPREWGLGTSSTLIYMMAQWSENNPWDILSMTMGGSGYDLACAGASVPLFYQIQNSVPDFQPTTLPKLIMQNAVFVYSGKKKNSSEGIKQYRLQGRAPAHLLQIISKISEDLTRVGNRKQFIKLLIDHEEIVGGYLDLTPIQQREFPDFKGAVKSLGAWGGDFFMAIADEEDAAMTKSWFRERGYSTILSYDELAFQAG